MEKGSLRPRVLSRRDFLKVGGAGLAGAPRGRAEQFNASLEGETTPKDAARTLERELESVIQQG